MLALPSVVEQSYSYVVRLLLRPLALVWVAPALLRYLLELGADPSQVAPLCWLYCWPGQARAPAP